MLGTGGTSKKKIQDAIAEALAGVSSSDNFSYNEIVTELTIPQYQQMIVCGELINSSNLVIIGTLAVING